LNGLPFKLISPHDKSLLSVNQVCRNGNYLNTIIHKLPMQRTKPFSARITRTPAPASSSGTFPKQDLDDGTIGRYSIVKRTDAENAAAGTPQITSVEQLRKMVESAQTIVSSGGIDGRKIMMGICTVGGRTADVTGKEYYPLGDSVGNAYRLYFDTSEAVTDPAVDVKKRAFIEFDGRTKAYLLLEVPSPRDYRRE